MNQSALLLTAFYLPRIWQKWSLSIIYIFIVLILTFIRVFIEKCYGFSLVTRESGLQMPNNEWHQVLRGLSGVIFGTGCDRACRCCWGGGGYSCFTATPEDGDTCNPVQKSVFPRNSAAAFNSSPLWDFTQHLDANQCKVCGAKLSEQLLNTRRAT